MRTRSAIAVALFVSTIAHAQSFQHERSVVPGGPGPSRLDADVALLAGSATGFPDLRMVDGSGREVAYLKIEPQPRERRWVTGSLLDVARTKTTSGFEVDLGSLRDVDRVRMNGITRPYLKHVTLEGSGDRAHWTLLADTTVFDLPDQDLRRSEIAFDAGSYRYLRVTWDDRSSARVNRPASAEGRLFDVIAPAEPLRADLPVHKLSSEPGRSRYRIDLPGPHLPIAAIEVRSGGGDMFRQATITEPQLTNGAIVPVTLGKALLRRAVRDGFTASDTAIAISSPLARELDLVVEDGSNPPLPDLVAVAKFIPQPWIYFESRDGSPLTARYGDQRLSEPHYDLEAVRPFVGRTSVTLAHWSPQPATTAIAPIVAPPMPAFGSSVDRAAFRVARPLQNTTPGLVVLPVDADVLAVSRDLTDVRIIDAQNRQVPYVVEHRDEPLTIHLAIPKREAGAAHESRYHLQLPYTTLPSGTRLVLTTSARVFQRPVRVVRSADEQRGREEVQLGFADWNNATPELTAAPLTFDVPLYGSHAVDVVVDEGDNAPLPVASADLLLPSYALRFNHPGGALTIVYGNSDAAAPRYDLALLAPRLLTEPARTIAIARPRTTREEAANNQSKYFWIVVGIAALLLLALLARLLGSALKEPGSLGETPRGGDSPR